MHVVYYLLFLMYCSDVRISNELNKAVWSHGVKGVQRRIRVRLSRKRNEDEDAKEKVSRAFVGDEWIMNLSFIVDLVDTECSIVDRYCLFLVRYPLLTLSFPFYLLFVAVHPCHLGQRSLFQGFGD
jgi:hypothetical protein